ncbi:hypothetical protein ACFVT5_00750 [Streptomyces sp. NPDC058001]|uniref:hypothetical protein n=1 Tax=Streptomyces sp. NPDC058001 TaxID=3346300 RepID=UPI0036ECE37A
MLPSLANEESPEVPREESAEESRDESRLSFWLRVREFAVLPSVIETATARRRAGDWAGACAAAGIDVDLNLRAVARTHGTEFVTQLRSDLRNLAPDLLRWHMPRIAPYGVLRPGLTVALARYEVPGRVRVRVPVPGRDGAVFLVVRTPPAWADAGQRMSLALWDGSRRSHPEARAAHRYPHPHPSRRFRLDLHRHLWDARRTDELRIRSGADRAPGERHSVQGPYRHCVVDQWAAEAAILLHAERHPGTGTATGTDPRTVAVRLGTRHWVHLDVDLDRNGLGNPVPRIAPATTDGGAAPSALPVLPDAATWALPDLDLLCTGSIEPDRLHPLVASALVPGHTPSGPSRTPDPADRPYLVECRGGTHRIGLVDGVLAPLDHDPAEIRREELLAELTGTPLACLRAIDQAHRHPDCLVGVRERLHHGDTAGALAVVEGLLGPDAVLREGALRDELERAVARRIAYGLFRVGLAGPGPGPRPGPAPVPVPAPGRRAERDRPDHHRAPDRLPGRPLHRRDHPRLATFS